MKKIHLNTEKLTLDLIIFNRLELKKRTNKINLFREIKQIFLNNILNIKIDFPVDGIIFFY
jgi:hypothetical protein